MLALLLILFWLYIVTECFICFWRMHRGDKLCRLAKYVMACVVPSAGICIFLLCKVKFMAALWLIPDIALALFFWPTTYARFTGGFKNRIGDR